MEIVKQLSIFLQNKPGVLAEVCGALAENKVNILGISVSDTVDHAVVRLVVSDPGLAREVLESGGALVVESDVAQMDLDDSPGILGEVAAKLAEASVNIEYAYGTAPFDGKARVYLRVSDSEKAAAVLK